MHYVIYYYWFKSECKGLILKYCIVLFSLGWKLMLGLYTYREKSEKYCFSSRRHWRIRNMKVDDPRNRAAFGNRKYIRRFLTIVCFGLSLKDKASGVLLVLPVSPYIFPLFIAKTLPRVKSQFSSSSALWSVQFIFPTLFRLILSLDLQQ